MSKKIILTKDKIIEGKVFKKNTQFKIKEAFTAGKASMVVEKLGKILTKKLGLTLTFSTVPLKYSNSFGEFAGYLGSLNSKTFVKINFQLTNSDTIVSFDVYTSGFSNTPDYTVDTDGLNIVQIVNLMYENLAEDDVIQITERTASREPKDLTYVIERFTDDVSSALKDLQNKPLADIYSGSWRTWAKDKPNYSTDTIKYYYWVKIVKFFLVERGLTNKTFRSRKKGTAERQVEDPILQAELDEITDAIKWQDKFEFLKNAITQMDKGRIQSIYAYGSPGSGKSYETKQQLDSLGSDYYIFKGGVKNTEALIRLLYTYRDNVILVFDDFDSALKGKDNVNIFKAALENSKTRMITWVPPKKGGDVPAQFAFESGVIFLSNEEKLDRALASRSVVIELTLSNSEVLEKIKDTLSDYMPEVDMDIKMKAFDYMREISPGVTFVDYRILNSIIVALEIGGNWKQMSLLMIKSMT